MREQIARWLWNREYDGSCSKEGWHKLWEGLDAEDRWCYYQGADQIVNLLKEKIEKSLLTDEEIDEGYVDGWAKRDVGVDSPLALWAINDDDSDLAVLRELMQAQLDKTRKALEE